MAQDNLLTAIIAHQEQTRQLLERVISEVRSYQELDKELALLSSRLATLEGLQKELVASCRSCREGMNQAIETLKEGRHADSRRQQERSEVLKDQLRADIKEVEDKVAEIDKRSAEIGARYGALLGLLTAAMLEAIRWIIAH